MPVGEVALAPGCLLGTVFGGFGGFGRFWRVFGGFGRFWEFGGFGGFGGFWRRLESFGAFGVFAGWQTAALKANNRKPLLGPSPRALALGCLFEKWPWPWGACWGRCLEGLDVFGGFGKRFWRVFESQLEGFGGFGGFGVFWRVFGGFWSVWRVLERLECLRAGKRQL